MSSGSVLASLCLVPNMMYSVLSSFNFKKLKLIHVCISSIHLCSLVMHCDCALLLAGLKER